MPQFLSPICNDQLIDVNGDPLVGGQIETYLAGSSTPAPTYTDDSGSVPQPNPIILNSLGYTPDPIWLTGEVSYKFVIKNAAGVIQRTVDDIAGVNDASVSQSEWVDSGLVPTYINATSFSVPGDQTTVLQIGRRVRTTNTSGLVYSTIANSVFAAGITTVTLTNDSTVLDAGLSAVAYALLAASPLSVPNLPGSKITGLITASGLTMNTARVLGRLTAGVGGVEELTQAQLRTLISLVHGQCRLALDGSNLRLSPYNGNQLLINGTPQSVPAAGVALAPTSLAASTTYFIYAYMVGATMTLEASTTGHSTDATTGVEIKTGDATRTLVGMARTTAGVAWVDSVTDRLVLSWFNRSSKDMLVSITAGNTTSATMVELNTANRLNFLLWADEVGRFNGSLYTTSSASGSTWATQLSYDNSALYGYGQFSGGTAVSAYQFAPAINARASEGFHFVTVRGQISGGATLTLNGGGTSSLSGSIQG